MIPKKLNQKMKHKNKIIIFSLAVLLMGGIFATTKATQYAGTVSCNTSTATSTYSFLAFGSGTTTMECLTRSVDSLSVNIILAASSTATRYRFRVERSINNQDWYADIGQLAELATSTPYTSTFSEYALAFASTTQGTTGGTSQNVNFSGTGTTTANFINFLVPTLRSDRTRLVFYIDANTNGGLSTSTNGAIRAEGIVKETVTR